MPKLAKMIIALKFCSLHTEISKPTGTTVPDKKVKEISSTDVICGWAPFPKLLASVMPQFAGQKPPEAALAADYASVASAAKKSVVAAAKFSYTKG